MRKTFVNPRIEIGKKIDMNIDNSSVEPST